MEAAQRAAGGARLGSGLGARGSEVRGLKNFTQPISIKLNAQSSSIKIQAPSPSPGLLFNFNCKIKNASAQSQAKQMTFANERASNAGCRRCRQGPLAVARVVCRVCVCCVFAAAAACCVLRVACVGACEAPAHAD